MKGKMNMVVCKICVDRLSDFVWCIWLVGIGVYGCVFDDV